MNRASFCGFEIPWLPWISEQFKAFSGVHNRSRCLVSFRDVPSVVLDRTFHQQEVTARLFKALPTFPERAFAPQDIWNAYVKVYHEIGHEDWLEAIWPYFERLGVVR